ncbi:hypothetical protein B0H13DRAFT_587151 [Mycena leptocephala]|nr:hypothetical protein B0H13DRAFT_587151 [Mycena leptocephala]
MPPPGWITAAHRQGVKMLGTLIFESSGKDDCLLLVEHPAKLNALMRSWMKLLVDRLLDTMDSEKRTKKHVYQEEPPNRYRITLNQ